MPLLRFFSLIALLATVLAAAPLQAGTLVVTNTNDSGPGSLRQAVNDANKVSGDDTILFDLPASAERVIKLTSNSLDLSSNIIILNDRPGDVPITIQTAPPRNLSIWAFYLTKPAHAVISGLTIAGPPGGIRSDEGDLTLRNCVVSGGNNILGGALYSIRGKATLIACQVTGNTASEGGGIYNEGGELNLYQCTLTGNTARNGGAIVAINQGHTTLVDCVLKGNQAHDTFTDSGNGGGIQGDFLTLSNCTFIDNTASGSGGAIYRALLLSANNCTFSNNQAGSGGAFYDYGSAYEFAPGLGHILFNNCTFSGNFAKAQSPGPALGGGAIYANYQYNNNSNPGMRLINCTFADNYLSGFAYPNGVTITASTPKTKIQVENTVFRRQNGGGRHFSMINGASLTSLGHNLTDDDASGDGGVGPGGLLNGPGDIRNTDPQLGPLADNGGLTQTHALLDGSPAINAGDPALVQPRDQRGYVRNGISDIGAFEFGGTVPVTRLANISTRLRTWPGDRNLIAGFIIVGTGQKKVMLRAIGPSLQGLTTLKDPTLTLYDSLGQVLAFNDNWGDAPNYQEISDSAIAPTNALESAILTTLAPGAYTAVVGGTSNSNGISVVEAYDLDPGAPSKLANISTRGSVETGDNVMIGGFIIRGPDSEKVLIRALGPSLPLTNTLADPYLELHDGNGAVLAGNNGWSDYLAEQAEIRATTIPPPNPSESAIVIRLSPGPYTAIVTGVEDGTGLAIVEVYGLE